MASYLTNAGNYGSKPYPRVWLDLPMTSCTEVCFDPDTCKYWEDDLIPPVDVEPPEALYAP